MEQKTIYAVQVLKFPDEPLYNEHVATTLEQLAIEKPDFVLEHLLDRGDLTYSEAGALQDLADMGDIPYLVLAQNTGYRFYINPVPAIKANGKPYLREGIDGYWKYLELNDKVIEHVEKTGLFFYEMPEDIVQLSGRLEQKGYKIEFIELNQPESLK